MAEHWKHTGDLIATRRRVCGFTSQEKFADALGVSKSTVGNLENGRRKGRHAEGFLEHVEDLLGWVEGSIMQAGEQGKAPRVKADQYLARVHQAWPKLDEQAKKIVVDIVESAIRRQ